MRNTELLNRLYHDISDIILQRQHPVTGLLPASTAITNHGNYTDAWVRDNVYSILSVWSLGIAYKHTGETERSDQLSQSTIKLMRGLLQSMMRQAPKVEKFKHTLEAIDSLHAKYDTATGLPVVADDAWGHLQIDATSIFLLMIAQMTASGLRIIKTYDEVDFVQNLVYYIAFAYRIPDFGIWERGNKINNGKTEINASSVGMAKAALQALDGFNLFGENASKRAVVHTIPDAVSRARNTLARLLPRESISKEVDSALLSVIGFPAFAVGDQTLVKKTRDKILTELGGDYGCKRFLWDGHQTMVEDHSRIHYEHNELANFEDIESEWPLFYTYLYIQALFDNDTDAAKNYRQKIENVMVEVDGKNLIPELYFVEADKVSAERENPGSQPRVPNENLPLVWAQSMYYTGLMLDEGLISADDLDPLRLRKRSTNNTETQIALVVLTDNQVLKEKLASHGVIAETIEEISPLKVMTSKQLVDVYQEVGANKALNLTGRPKRRFQSLATAQTYHINQNNYLSLSSLQQDKHNYRLFDAELASESLEKEIAHITKHWTNNEVAVFTYLINQDMYETKNADVLLQTIRQLQLRTNKQNVGYASASLALRASRVNRLYLPNHQVTSFTNIELNEYNQELNLATDNLTPEFKTFVESNLSNDESCYLSLKALVTQYSLESDISTNGSINFKELITAIYHFASIKQFWLTARCCFSVLDFSHRDLADDLSLLCARNLTILVGENNHTVLSGENGFLDQDELIHTLNIAVKTPVERSLAQELLVVLGHTIRTNTQLFDGIRSIHLHNLLSLCETCVPDSKLSDIEQLSLRSPYELKQQVQQVLESQHQAYDFDVKSSFSEQDGNQTYEAEKAQAVDTDWLEWRSERGLIARFDDSFLESIWQSLAHCPKIVFGDRADDKYFIDNQLIRSSMTPGEESFAHLIDSLIQHAHPIYYKAALVEVLAAYISYCKDNAELKLNDSLVLGDILAKAAALHTQAEGESPEARSNLEQLLQTHPKSLQKYVTQVISSLN
ncbi:glycoside hydrolase family 15 protein [Catenovulum maritimum]|uniref:Phosphorylase kinase n=1 Tax=Catenovulum maritimum TaxID=1513271 RepID=A0A0J8GVT7_9ALTE|nr:glycoside hydrolase family 15 protein [Catenovulum maritimum]KMT65429.1 phosphorylase kinase [Catenovulum maritimum]